MKIDMKRTQRSGDICMAEKVYDMSSQICISVMCRGLGKHTQFSLPRAEE